MLKGSRVYYYILSHDGGVAPCVDGGLLTLAICKPGIRRTGSQGDWIIGFSPKEMGWKLSFVARITEKLHGENYYGSGLYDGRRDCIYRLDGNGDFTLRNSRIHNSAKNRAKDVGTKENKYENAWVLKSEEFWYFGAKAWNAVGPQTPNLVEKLRALSQGHRVNHSTNVRQELDDLIKSVREKFKPGIHGSPRDSSNHLDDKSDHYGSCH